MVKQLLCAGLVFLGWTSGASAQTTYVEYIHTDALGSPVATTNAAGVVIEQQVYEPYGAPIAHGPTDGPGYTGHVEDSATGLTYMQQRYYDSQLGRFLSIDPVGINPKSGRNFGRYYYANDNPYLYKDPDGRYTCRGSAEGCAAVRKAMAQVRAQLSSATRGGAFRGALKAVSDFYGGEGKNNGVIVEVGQNSGIADQQRSGESQTIRVDVGQHEKQAGLRGKDSSWAISYLAGSLWHEGMHGIQSRYEKEPASREEELNYERAGATIEGRVFELLKEDSPWGSWTQEKGFRKDRVEEQARKSTEIWCLASQASGC